jgi:hypothetical protein
MIDLMSREVIVLGVIEFMRWRFKLFLDILEYLVMMISII